MVDTFDSIFYDFTYECNKISVNKSEITIQWVIKDFTRLLGENSQFMITEKNYKYHTSDDAKFKLKITKVMDGDRGEILKFSFKPTPTTMFVGATLMSRQESGRKSLAVITYDLITKRKWTLMTEQSKQHVLESLNHNCLVLEYWFLYNSENCTGLSPLVLSRLRNDMYEFHTSSTDVKVKSADGVELPAHKNRLALRSPVFKAHLQQGTDVIVSPFETDVLQEIIHYINDDKLPKQNAMIQKLVTAADFYQLEGLKVYCQKKIKKMHSANNASDMQLG